MHTHRLSSLQLSFLNPSSKGLSRSFPNMSQQKMKPCSKSVSPPWATHASPQSFSYQRQQKYLCSNPTSVRHIRSTFTSAYKVCKCPMEEDCKKHVPLVSISIPGVLNGQQILPLGQCRLAGIEQNLAPKSSSLVNLAKRTLCHIVFRSARKNRDFWIQEAGRRSLCVRM